MMVHSKRFQTIKALRTVSKHKSKLLLFGLLISTSIGYSQGLETLATELNQTESTISTISGSVISIIKIIAGIALAISAIGFLYLRSQENDMSKKAGQMVIGVGIFFIIMTLVDLVQG